MLDMYFELGTSCQYFHQSKITEDFERSHTTKYCLIYAMRGVFVTRTSMKSEKSGEHVLATFVEN